MTDQGKVLIVLFIFVFISSSRGRDFSFYGRGNLDFDVFRVEYWGGFSHLLKLSEIASSAEGQCLLATTLLSHCEPKAKQSCFLRIGGSPFRNFLQSYKILRRWTFLWKCGKLLCLQVYFSLFLALLLCFLNSFISIFQEISISRGVILSSIFLSFHVLSLAWFLRLFWILSLESRDYTL